LFICNINNNLGLKEIVKSKIPLMGLVDSNMNPEFFLYPFIGNNDSIESIKFCFSLLALSQKESMIQERKTLYYLVLLKIKQMLKK
jgi:ribosomal protein S2